MPRWSMGWGAATGWVLAGALLGAPSGWAMNEGSGHQRRAALYDQPVRRNYRNTSRYLFVGRNIVLQGTPEQVLRLSRWLDEIAAVSHGKATLQAILASSNQLTIRHSPWALIASGRTLAPLSEDLTNGRGEDIEILFDVRIPEHGSHRVFNRAGEPIAFTALHNLFHELVHARHQLNGTWRYWDSEGQAIEEENLFRMELQAGQDGRSAEQRAGIRGQQFWWPADQR